MATCEVKAVVGHGFDTDGATFDETLVFKTTWIGFPTAQFTYLEESGFKAAKKKLTVYLANLGVTADMTAAEREKLLKATATKVDRDEEKVGEGVKVEKIVGHYIVGKKLSFDVLWDNGEVVPTQKSSFAGDRKLLQKYLEVNHLTDFYKRTRSPAPNMTNTGTRSRRSAAIGGSSSVPSSPTSSSIQMEARAATKIPAKRDAFKTPVKSSKSPVGSTPKTVNKAINKMKSLASGGIKGIPKAAGARSMLTPVRGLARIASPSNTLAVGGAAVPGTGAG